MQIVDLDAGVVYQIKAQIMGYILVYKIFLNLNFFIAKI
jgi:hypothetical protein